jgi:hypothetical protein
MKGFPHILFHETPDGHEKVDEEAVMRSLSNQEVEGDGRIRRPLQPSIHGEGEALLASAGKCPRDVGCIALDAGRYATS